jgi:hypothetical protein
MRLVEGEVEEIQRKIEQVFGFNGRDEINPVLDN